MTSQETARRIYDTDRGPIILSLSVPADDVRITVDPDATAAHISLFCDNATGPAADRIDATEFIPQEGRVAVILPAPATPARQSHHGGGVFISGDNHGSIVSVSSGSMTIVNGVVIGGATTTAALPDERIRVRATLPPGSGLIFFGDSASLEVTGSLKTVGGKLTNGNARLDSVGTLGWASENGSIEAREVRGSTVVRTNNGRIRVGAFLSATSSADLTTVNGPVHFTAAPGSAAPVTIRTVNGSIDFTGSPESTSPAAIYAGNGNVTLRGDHGGPTDPNSITGRVRRV